MKKIYCLLTLTILAGRPAFRVEPGSDDVLVWNHNGKHYLRTTHTLMWPAWTAVVNGAGNTKCYEVPVTSRLMLSRNGQILTIRLQVSQ